MAATRRLHVESPLPAWAAYLLSSVSEKNLALSFAKEASVARSPLERTYYTAAAARMGDEEALKKLGPMLSDRRTPAQVRVEIAQVLGAEDPDAMKRTLLTLLRERDAEVQIAALASLADAGDEGVVPEIMEAMSSFSPVVAEAARAAVIRFGRKAEDGLQASLSGDDRAACAAALRILVSLGKKASKTSIEAAIEAMKKHSRDAAMRVLAGEALSAMSGRRGKPEWTWVEWSKATGVRVAAPVATGDQTWEWLSIRVPAGWVRRGDFLRRSTGSGDATIRAFTERDPGLGEEPLALADRRYRDAAALRAARIVNIATRKIGDQHVPLPNITVQKRPLVTIGSGKGRVRLAPLFIYNKPRALVSYYMFLVVAGKGASWYAEIECSAGEKQYGEHKKFFEKDLVKTLRIDAAKLK
jgi:HEAT repeat protein